MKNNSYKNVFFIFRFYNTLTALTGKLDGNALDKKNLVIFSCNYKFFLIKLISISTHSIKLFFLLLNMLLQYPIYFIKTLRLDQMRMGWKRHNPVGKQILLTEKIFDRNFK